jgi:hypothetical protein
MDTLNQMFDRQISTLLKQGYPRMTGMSERTLLGHCERLRRRLRSVATGPLDLAAGRIPFVLVVSGHRQETAAALARVRRNGRPGLVSMKPVTPADFAPLASLRLPKSPVYLLGGFDRGDNHRNVTPEDALRRIREDGRSPLTIEEGVAVLTHYPDVLVPNHCFSLSGSRREDQRVPALWLSGGRPKLGWCWDRNPHTWLGSASCRRRGGVRPLKSSA